MVAKQNLWTGLLLALAKIKMMTSLSHLTADKLSPSDVQKLAVSSETENIFPCLSVTLFPSQIVLPIRTCLSSSLFNYFNRHPKSWDVRNSVSGLSVKVLLLRFPWLCEWHLHLSGCQAENSRILTDHSLSPISTSNSPRYLLLSLHSTSGSDHFLPLPPQTQPPSASPQPHQILQQPPTSLSATVLVPLQCLLDTEATLNLLKLFRSCSFSGPTIWESKFLQWPARPY